MSKQYQDLTTEEKLQLLKSMHSTEGRKLIKDFASDIQKKEDRSFHVACGTLTGLSLVSGNLPGVVIFGGLSLGLSLFRKLS